MFIGINLLNRGDNISLRCYLFVQLNSNFALKCCFQAEGIFRCKNVTTFWLFAAAAINEFIQLTLLAPFLCHNLYFLLSLQ